MDKEVIPYLQTIADTIRENNAEWIINQFALKDIRLAQVLDILIVEEV